MNTTYKKLHIFKASSVDSAEFLSTDDSPSPLWNYKNGQPDLPIGVKCICFSYLESVDLLSTICRLSEDVREYVCKTAVLDQEREFTYKASAAKQYSFEMLLYSLKMATSINFQFSKWDQLETFHFSMIMNQFQDKLKLVLFPMVGPTKNQDEKMINKLVSRHTKLFNANDTKIILKTDDIKEAIPDYASGVQLFSALWSLKSTAQIPKENIEQIKSLSVEVETFSYLDSILKKVTNLSELEEIQLVPKTDFMRQIWSSFDLSKFSKMKSIEFINNHNPQPITIPTDFKIAKAGSTLEKIKVIDPGAIYKLDNILSVCGAQYLKEIDINFEQLLIQNCDQFIGQVQPNLSSNRPTYKIVDGNVYELVRQQINDNGYWLTFQQMIRGQDRQFHTCNIKINFNSLKVAPTQ